MADNLPAGPPNYGLSDEEVARIVAITDAARASEAEIHRMRGEYLSIASGAEGILNHFLAMYFLRHRDDSNDQQALLEHWYSWLLANLRFGAKLELVERLCKDGLDMERIQSAGFPDVLVDLRRVNERRNQLAHASVHIWPSSTSSGIDDYAVDVVSTRVTRKAFLGAVPIDPEVLAEWVDDASDVFERLHTTWLASHLVPDG